MNEREGNSAGAGAAIGDERGSAATPAVLMEAAERFNIVPDSLRANSMGVVHRTWFGQTRNNIEVTLQEVHPRFRSLDFTLQEVVATQLAQLGFALPRVVRSSRGLFIEEVGGGCFRARTTLLGSCCANPRSAAELEPAGQQVARLTVALAAVRLPPSLTVDVSQNVSTLESHLDTLMRSARPDVQQIARRIMSSRRTVEGGIDSQLTHGDLKWANLVQLSAGDGHALGFIDWDTLGMRSLHREFADVLRSWSRGPGPAFSLGHIKSAASGLAMGLRTAGAGHPIDARKLFEQLLDITLELASRYAVHWAMLIPDGLPVEAPRLMEFSDTLQASTANEKAIYNLKMIDALLSNEVELLATFRGHFER